MKAAIGLATRKKFLLIEKTGGYRWTEIVF
ncbi:MAG: hypothetical protein PWP53_1364 [Lacrimispora sp.]|nr:hypothetical protein [Lacrimispora sp.]